MLGLYQPNFKNNRFFSALYTLVGGDKAKLDNAAMSTLFEKYKNFKEAELGVLSIDIESRFKALGYEPEVLSQTIQLTMSANNAVYSFQNYLVLENTLLVDFIVPIYNSMTKTLDNKDLLTAADMGNCYLLLNNSRQQSVRKYEPLVNYFRDGAYWPGKGQFKDARIDWKTSNISFPDATVPGSNVGKVLQVVVYYIDMKRYPELNNLNQQR